MGTIVEDVIIEDIKELIRENSRLKAENEKLKAECKELKFENNKLRQWTLNDAKVRHGFELAIETLKKCKEV